MCTAAAVRWGFFGVGKGSNPVGVLRFKKDK
jgi:hypothetical protein